MPRYDDDDRPGDNNDIRIGSRQRDAGPLHQSGLGMASIGVSVFMFLAFLVLIGIAAVIGADENAPMEDGDPRAVALGLGFIAALGFTLFGIVVGLVGCCQPSRSPLCGALGALFNAILLLVVLGVFALMFIVFAMGG